MTGVLTGNGKVIMQVIAVETESMDGGTKIGNKGIEMVGNIAYQEFFFYSVGHQLVRVWRQRISTPIMVWQALPVCM